MKGLFTLLYYCILPFICFKLYHLYIKVEAIASNFILQQSEGSKMLFLAPLIIAHLILIAILICIILGPFTLWFESSSGNNSPVNAYYSYGAQISNTYESTKAYYIDGERVNVIDSDKEQKTTICKSCGAPKLKSYHKCSYCSK
jgi:hypothetical protein